MKIIQQQNSGTSHADCWVRCELRVAGVPHLPITCAVARIQSIKSIKIFLGGLNIAELLLGPPETVS